jgi:hypothetical protein
MLLEHFPPHQTTYAWFARFRDDGTWQGANRHLLMLDHERVGREATLSGGVMDRQGVKTTEAGGQRGYDAAKKTNGRKQATGLVDIDGRRRCRKSAPPMPRVATAPYRCREHLAAGWSSASSPGSAATTGWPRISRARSHQPTRSSMPQAVMLRLRKLACSSQDSWLKDEIQSKGFVLLDPQTDPARPRGHGSIS